MLVNVQTMPMSGGGARTIVGSLLVLLLAAQVSAMGMIAPQETSARVNQARVLEFIVRGDGSSRTIKFFTSAPVGWATFNGTSDYREVQDSISGYEEKHYVVEVVPRKEGLLKITWGVRISGGAGVGMEEVIQDVLQLHVSNPGGDVVVTVPTTTKKSSSSGGGGGGGSVYVASAKNATVKQGPDVPVVANEVALDGPPVQDAASQEALAQGSAGDLKEEFVGSVGGEEQGVESSSAVPITREKVVAFGVVMLGLIAVFVQFLFLRTWRRDNA